MHIPLGRIIPQHPVHHNPHLAVGEPPLGPEPRLGLHGRRGHHEEADEADGKGDDSLDKEQPPPAAPAVDAAEVQQGEGEQGGDYSGDGEGGPEVGEADGEFVGGVEVGEPEDDVGDESALGSLVSGIRRERERGGMGKYELRGGRGGSAWLGS